MADHELRYIEQLLRGFDRTIGILDVGAGLGEKSQFLRDIGFSNIIGVEKNPVLVDQARKMGRNVHTVESFGEMNAPQFDLLLMSHIIEHFEHEPLKDFLEHYLRLLKENGHLLILTPVPQDFFYDDFDHVRPYGPRGITQVFGNNTAQVQFYSPNRLTLEDIYYVRRPLQLKFFRALTLRGRGYRFVRLANQLLSLIFHISFGLIGRATVWVGLFRKETNKTSGHTV